MVPLLLRNTSCINAFTLMTITMRPYHILNWGIEWQARAITSTTIFSRAASGVLALEEEYEIKSSREEDARKCYSYKVIHLEKCPCRQSEYINGTNLRIGGGSAIGTLLAPSHK